MKKLLNTVTLLLIASTFSSCISLKSDKYLAIKSEEIRVSSVKKSKVFIDWDFNSSFFGQTSRDAIRKLKADQKNILTKLINESGCCIILDKKDEASLVIKGSFQNNTSSVGMVFSLITGFSLYTIPSWINVKMNVYAKVEKNKISKEYLVDDSLIFAQWLPFVVVPIFAGNQVKVESEINENLYKNLLLQIKKDGFFDN